MGATFDTLAALLLSLVIAIPELPGPEVRNVRNAGLSGELAGSPFNCGKRADLLYSALLCLGQSRGQAAGLHFHRLTM